MIPMHNADVHRELSKLTDTALVFIEHRGETPDGATT